MDGEQQSMEQLTLERTSSGGYKISCWFPYPQRLDGPKYFEVVVPQFRPLKFRTECKVSGFKVNFSDLH